MEKTSLNVINLLNFPVLTTFYNIGEIALEDKNYFHLLFCFRTYLIKWTVWAKRKKYIYIFFI